MLQHLVDSGMVITLLSILLDSKVILALTSCTASSVVQCLSNPALGDRQLVRLRGSSDVHHLRVSQDQVEILCTFASHL